MNENINNPAHYTQQPVECIEFTQHMNFCLGNAFKYVWRYADKNGTEDLEKARWYLQHHLDEELLTDLVDDIWADGQEALHECRFDDAQEAILRTIWFGSMESADPDYVLVKCIAMLDDMIGERR